MRHIFLILFQKMGGWFLLIIGLSYLRRALVVLFFIGFYHFLVVDYGYKLLLQFWESIDHGSLDLFWV